MISRLWAWLLEGSCIEPVYWCNRADMIHTHLMPRRLVKWHAIAQQQRLMKWDVRVVCPSPRVFGQHTRMSLACTSGAAF